MYEKILQKLKTQRGTTSNVSDRSLEDMAKSLSVIITSDEQLATADMSAVIKSIDGNISHYTAKQVEDAKAKAKAEALEELKKGSDPIKKTDEKKQEIDPLVAQLMEQNKLIMEQLSGIKTEKLTNSRIDQLNKVIDGMPDFIASPIKASFKADVFKDDEEFGAYIEGVKQNRIAFEQKAKENGMNFAVPSSTAKKIEDDGRTPEIAMAYKIVEDAKSKK